MSEHLEFDTNFLDKDTIKEKKRTSHSTRTLTEKKHNWKKTLIIGGIILFFLWIIFSEDNSSSSTNTGANNSSDTLVIGEYRCSKYDYDKAVALNPDESEQQIDTAISAMESRSNELDRLKKEIDSSYVNEYSSQYQINQYNETVDEYNAKLATYKSDSSNLEPRIDKYNAQIKAHNNYLKNNCTLNK